MDDFNLDASDFGVEDSTSTETTAPPSAETQTNPPAQAEEGTSVTDTTPTTTEQMHNLRFNHEDKPVSYEELIQLGQKGLNYDKLQDRLSQFEQDPRLSFVDQLAQENNLSTEEFIEAFMYERQQAEIEEMIQNNIPREYAEEMVKNREFRNQLEQERQAREEKEAQDREFLDFFEKFKALNGREFDAVKDKDDIPQEVWQMKEQGIPMRFAYLEHFVSKLQTENAVLRQNKKNSESSPVSSTTSFGSNGYDGEDEFLIGFNSV